MRLFYAITFKEETKEELYKYRNMIAEKSVKGNFTTLNNIHLTLEFIGEADGKGLKVLADVLHQLKSYPEKLMLSSTGSFNKGNKEIVWLGIEKNEELIRLQCELREVLINNGFKIEGRSYKPHITIGRQVVTIGEIQEVHVKPMEIPIKSIALMESKRINGELVYKPLEEIKI